MVVSSLWIGMLAALCTCTGLALVRRLPPGPRPRGLLTMGASGLVLFILIDVGYQALGTVELVAVSENVTALVLSGVLLLAGLLFGMVGLAWIESRRGHPGADTPQPLDVAVMLAVGVGLHSFAQGLSVGQSIATTLSGPGVSLLLGLALRGVADGAAVGAPVAGQPMPLGRLLLLAACAAGPSLFGTMVGTTWVGPGLELLVLSLAAGVLVYVLRELLRAPIADVATTAAMWALALGLVAGLATEMLVNFERLGGGVAVELALPAVHAQEPPRGRLQPPSGLPCSRNELTSYTGRVTRYAITTDRTTIVIATDAATTETVAIAHVGMKDASAYFLIDRAPFQASDWKRIQDASGRLKKGQRATAWVCTNGKVIVEWYGG